MSEEIAHLYFPTILPDRIIVELLVTSVLTIPFTLWMYVTKPPLTVPSLISYIHRLSTIFKRHVTGNARHHMIELILLSILWAMFLVGAIITTVSIQVIPYNPRLLT